MGVKKTAHITLYSYNKNAKLPSNCSIGSRANYTNNFIDLPYNAVLCELINANNFLNVSTKIVQAAGRTYVENYVVNTDHSFQKGGMYDEGESVMLDFSLFQAYTVEGNLLDNKEHMVAYFSNSFQYDSLANDDVSAADPSNDKIGSILTALDPSRINQETVDFLVGMASMRVRWENGDYSDFLLHRFQVLDGVETPIWWIITVIVLGLVFLAPQTCRLFVRHIPEYAEYLRTLLLLTLERSGVVVGGKKKVGNVGISLNDEDNDIDRTALPSVNGYPVAIANKLASADKSLIDKNTNYIDDKYV